MLDQQTSYVMHLMGKGLCQYLYGDNLAWNKSNNSSLL